MTPGPAKERVSLDEDLLYDIALLRAWNDLVDDSAAKLLDFHMENVRVGREHRNEMRRKAQENAFKLAMTDQKLRALKHILGFIVAMTGITGGIWLTANGNQTYMGALLAGTSFSGIITAFVAPHFAQRKAATVLPKDPVT